MLKKIGIILFTCICAILIAATPVFAKNNCKKPGCTRQPVSGPNRDGYCYEHSPRNKAVRCRETGCTNNAYHGSSYCYMHECVVTSCKKIKGLGVCTVHRSLQDSNSTKTGNNSGKNNGKKKPTYEMPDCDDYDSYEDFMDDWDGCMPDGSDAEDYRDNW